MQLDSSDPRTGSESRCIQKYDESSIPLLLITCFFTGSNRWPSPDGTMRECNGSHLFDILLISEDV